MRRLIPSEFVDRKAWESRILREAWRIGKGVAEAALVPAARLALGRQGRSGAAAILSCHNVVAAGTRPWGDLSLHLPLDAFRARLDSLQATHRVVPLRQLPQQDGADERPRAAITFDDAYRGCLRLALPELVQRGLPATVFVPPGLLGAKGFWWDLLAVEGTGLPPEVRRRSLEREAGRPGPAGEAPHSDFKPATIPELFDALALPGVEVGPHSWSHPNLTALEGWELEAELRRPRDWLVERFPGRTLTDHLSFPYGLWDPRVAQAAAVAGYRYLYRVDGVVATPLQTGPEPVILSRINVPSRISQRGFGLRTAGLLR